ncbi:TVP38/TMEM64 family protein [Pararhizobium mangrovi]|uniref:TVP38/TMEM64 family membrane protein n=1 Tax=Pararhizobium mangrovi TaxID=2590452 RepID=A0A506U520_9HYPH|nr:VTT domain-containing protein [Pararhizobium mangrovi]TPW28174.1 TVP38/TMEM64 family protein [Pararhizobium mangrovi]
MREGEGRTDTAPGEETTGPSAGSRNRWTRFLPLAVLLALLAAGYAAGLQRYVSLDALADRRAGLQAYVAAHTLLSGAIFAGIYVLAVAASFPAASLFTITGGFLFGWLGGGLVTSVSATIGATIIFLAARTAFSSVLRRRAGGAIHRLAGGFERDAFSYLLALRLAPIFPFFVINVAPAFFRVSLFDYVVATYLGILPGTFAYAYLGEGLDSVLVSAAKAGRSVTLSDIVTPEITIAFVALAVVALIPMLVRRFRSR